MLTAQVYFREVAELGGEQVTSTLHNACSCFHSLRAQFYSPSAMPNFRVFINAMNLGNSKFKLKTKETSRLKFYQVSWKATTKPNWIPQPRFCLTRCSGSVIRHLKVTVSDFGD